MKRSAVISGCGQFRYHLSRNWTDVVPPALPDAPGLLLLQDGREAWAASGPTQGLWESLASFARAQYMTADQQQAMHAIEQAVLGRPMPWNIPSKP